MDLLDSIHERFDAAMSSKNRAGFPATLEQVVDSVQKSRDKVAWEPPLSCPPLCQS